MFVDTSWIRVTLGCPPTPIAPEVLTEHISRAPGDDGWFAP